MDLPLIGVFLGNDVFFVLVEIQVHPSEIKTDEEDLSDRALVEVVGVSPLQTDTHVVFKLIGETAFCRRELVGREFRFVVTDVQEGGVTPDLTQAVYIFLISFALGFHCDDVIERHHGGVSLLGGITS